MWKSLIIALCVKTYECRTPGSDYPERCQSELNACLRYLEGRWAHDLLEASRLCAEEQAGRTLEIKSREMQRFVESYLGDLLRERLGVGNGFVAFVGLRRSDLQRFESVSTGKASKLVPLGNNSFSKNFDNRNILTSKSCEKRRFCCVYPERASCPHCKTIYDRKAELADRNLTWYEARDYCLRRGADLMDDELAEGSLSRRFPLIQAGMVKVKWSWPDEDHFATYTNWKGGCENTLHGDDMKCTVITGDFTWMPSRCNLAIPAPIICTKEMYGNSCERVHPYKLAAGAFGSGCVLLLALVLYLVSRNCKRKRSRNTYHSYAKIETPSHPQFRRARIAIESHYLTVPSSIPSAYITVVT